MLRKFTPFITTLLAMLLDTSVIPLLYHGTYAFPLTLVVVLCIGLLLGRLRGLLFGMIGGVLIDISSGTLGMMSAVFTMPVLDRIDMKIPDTTTHEKKWGR